MTETIFALATARGKAGIAVVRLSGPLAHQVVEHMSGPLPPIRQAALRRLEHEGIFLDEALVLVFAHGASFTGEQSAELHLHGSTAIVSEVLRCLATLPGLRMAEPGEFTRRALENGQLDLAQVEGLADLIDAETEAQRRQALRVLSGAVGAKAEQWRRALLRAMALLEASIDFADEDVPVDVGPEVLELIEGLIEDLSREQRGVAVAERVRDGFEVAIVGRPNSGKSTLLNWLAAREAAITSDVPGTTRDVIEVRLELAGLPVTLLDTAGLRQSTDPVELIGMKRAMERASQADLRIFLLDGTGLPEGCEPETDDIVIEGKSDLSGLPGVSGRTGEGVEQLVAAIADRLSARTAAAATLTRARHRQAVDAGLVSLRLAVQEMRGAGRNELAAQHLRDAMMALDSLTGRIGVEALLGEIFASFCIGK